MRYGPSFSRPDLATELTPIEPRPDIQPKGPAHGVSPAAPVVRVLLAAALWGVNGVVARSLFNRQVDPAHLVAIRMLLGGAALWALMLVRGGWRLAPRRFAAVAGYGLILVSVQLSYFKAIQLAGVAVALFLQYTAPLLVAGWEAMRARRWPPRPVSIALAAATTGSALLVLPGGSLQVPVGGIAWGIISAIGFAAGTVIGGSLRRRGTSGTALVAWGLILGALWLGPIWSPWAAVAAVRAADWPYFLYVAVLATAVPFALFASALGHVRGSVAILVAMLEPVLGAALAWAILGEALAPAQMAGGALILAAVALAAVGARD